MIRIFYICLLRLHPRLFRERFAGEMLEIFDQASADRRGISFFADGFLSLWRQWAMRSEFRDQPQPASDGPTFYMGGSDTPRAGALIHGAVLSVFIFSAICYILSHSNSHAGLLVGSRNHSFSHFLQAHTVSAAPTDLSAELRLRPEPEAHRVSPYFSLMPVLLALDADNDGVISASEIAHSSVALLTLDKNHDNKLSAEECGLRVPHPTRAIRQEFMHFHPVLAALDANHDGEISASEILNAPAALLTLDKNHDGWVSEDELLPDPAANERILRRSRRREHR